MAPPVTAFGRPDAAPVFGGSSLPPNSGVLAAAGSGLFDFIGRHGGEADRVLGIAGVDPGLLLQPTASLPLPR